MNTRLMLYWFHHIVSVTRIIDKLNFQDAPFIALCNEAIRRVVGEVEGYIVETTATAELPAIDLGEAS